MKRLLVTGGLLMAVVLAGGEAFAQTGTARGKVLDEAGNPIVDVKVMLDFLGGVTRHYETKTNKKGEFTQVGLFPGDYKISAGKDGFVPNGFEHKVGIGRCAGVGHIPYVGCRHVPAAVAVVRQCQAVCAQLVANARAAHQRDIGAGCQQAATQIAADRAGPHDADFRHAAP